MVKLIRIIARLNIGGPAIHTVLLSSGLNRDGYKDILVCGKTSDSEGDMLYFARENKIEPILIPELMRKISFKNDLKAFSRLYSLMKKERPDIVHTHTAKAGALGRLAAIFAGVPVKIHTFHGHIFDGYFSPFKAKLFMFIERCLGYFTDKVIVVSESVRDEIVDRLKIVPKDKCVVIKLGLDLGRFLKNENLKGIFRKEIGASDDSLLVGIIGRLVPIKNHKMFLGVVRKIKDKTPDIKARFLIIGDGELRSNLEEYTKRLNLEEDVIFTGWIKDLAKVYADLDVVALTSLNEGTPVSLIEAMASARSVISTDAGGVKDIVLDNETGVLVKSGDVRDFTDKLCGLLNDKEKRLRLSSSAREFVRNTYDKNRLVKDIENLYEKCLSKKNHPK